MFIGTWFKFIKRWKIWVYQDINKKNESTWNMYMKLYSVYIVYIWDKCAACDFERYEKFSHLSFYIKKKKNDCTEQTKMSTKRISLKPTAVMHGRKKFWPN